MWSEVEETDLGHGVLTKKEKKNKKSVSFEKINKITGVWVGIKCLRGYYNEN